MFNQMHWRSKRSRAANYSNLLWSLSLMARKRKCCAYLVLFCNQTANKTWLTACTENDCTLLYFRNVLYLYCTRLTLLVTYYYSFLPTYSWCIPIWIVHKIRYILVIWIVFFCFLWTISVFLLHCWDKINTQNCFYVKLQNKLNIELKWEVVNELFQTNNS
jgi:hypothetical protein